MTNDDGISIYANLIKEERNPPRFSAFWLIGKISQYAFRDILSLLHRVVKPFIPVRGGVTPHPWANDNPHALRGHGSDLALLRRALTDESGAARARRSVRERTLSVSLFDGQTEKRLNLVNVQLVDLHVPVDLLLFYTPLVFIDVFPTNSLGYAQH